MSRCATTIVSLVTAVALAAPAVTAPAPAAATTAPALQSSAAAQKAYCETSDELTFGGVFNLTVEAISKTFAGNPEQQAKFENNARKYAARLGNLEINRLLVTTPASQIGGPAREVDDHAVNLVVCTLMKGRDNGWNDTVQLKNIAINEAIEAALTVLYFGSIPVELWGKVMPDLLQVSFLHIFSVSPMTLPKLTAKYGPKLIKKIADFVQGKLQNACLSTKPSGSTPHEYNHNPKPIKNPNKFPGKQAMNVQKIVDGLSVASETCRPLSEYTLREISTEVVDGMRKQVRPEFASIFNFAAKVYLGQLEFIKVNQGTIPMRSDQVGGLIELIDDPTVTYVYTVGTSPFDGRAWKWIPAGDLTVENGMNTYTLVADIAEKITSIMWKLIVQGVGDKIATKAVQMVIPGFGEAVCGVPGFVGGKVVGAIPGKLIEEGVAAVVGVPVVSKVAGKAVASALPVKISTKVIGTVAGKLATKIIDTEIGKPCETAWSILGLPEWSLQVVPDFVPLMFFYPDYVHPVVHGVTRSICLTRDQGKPAQWRRSPDMIEEDAELAAKRGEYTLPSDLYFTVPLINKQLPKPFGRDKKWKKHDKDVPKREGVFDTIPQATVTPAKA